MKQGSNRSFSWLEFLPPYCHPVAPYSLAVVLAFAAGLVFVIFRFGRLEHELDQKDETTDPEPGPAKVSARVALISVACLVLASLSLLFWAITRTATWWKKEGEGVFEWLFINTTGSAASSGVGWIWIGSLSCAASACLVLDLRSGRFPRIGGRWREWVLVSGLTVATGAFYCYQITDWRYSIIGDEYRFLTQIELFERVGFFPLFSERGVYDFHPQLCSAYQLVFMKLLGHSVFAWRFSSVFAAAIAVPALYVFIRLLWGMRPAIFAASLLAMSHYSYTFAHIPYNNNHVLFPIIASLALFVWARSCQSALLSGLCGMMAGMGFYTYLTARTAILIVAVFFGASYFTLSWTRVRRVVPLALALSLGFIVVALPIARNPVDSWKRGISLTGFSERLSENTEAPNHLPSVFGIQSTDESSERIKKNVVHSVLAPLTYDAKQSSARHFVRGGLVDRITSGLALLGLCYVTCFAWKRRWIGIWIGYWIVMAVGGMASETDYPAITRMLVTVPFLVIMATVGLEKVFLLARDSWGIAMARVLVSGLITGALILNIHQVVFAFQKQVPVTCPHREGQ